MAKVKVNKDQWDALSKETQERIWGILVQAGLIHAQDVIVGDAKKEVSKVPIVMDWDIGKAWCEAQCDVAASAAFAACSLLSNGAAVAACYAATEIARQSCRDNC